MRWTSRSDGTPRVDRLQELQELLAPMPPMTFADDFAGGHVERREQRRGAMAAIVVRPPLGRPERHRQNRSGAIECLNLTLLIDAQDRARGPAGSRYKPDDVADFLDEQGVARELERLAPMRLQPKGAPDPADRGCDSAPSSFRQRPRTPVRRVARFGFASVSIITCSTCASVIRRGAPGRGSSTQTVQPLLRGSADASVPPSTA